MANVKGVILACAAFLFFAGLALPGVAWVCAILGSRHLYGKHSQGQVALAIALCGGVAAWLTAEVSAILSNLFKLRPQFVAVAQQEELPGKVVGKSSDDTAAPQAELTGGAPEVSAPSSAPAATSTLDAHLPVLRAVAELAALLAFTYLCDRTDVFPDGPKQPNRMHFWGLWSLIAIAALCTCKELKSAKPLQRQQSDEWKGWMQLMFLMYHYFEEKEVYNAIRIYIAAYVWMTGYGNFCYYARKGDFSSKRLLHTLFRLNFLGFCACVLLHNEYMLYYICMMHTLFTLLVILALYIKQELNQRMGWAYGKMFGLVVLMLLLYDGPYKIFQAVFSLPVLQQLAAFHDPLHPEFTDELHEMHFRTGLDRFIWIIGMVFALHIGDFEKLMDKVAQQSDTRRSIIYGSIALPALALGGCWVAFVFSKEKYDYNAIHPYTSSVPIGVYLLLRNLVPDLRSRYMHLFAFLGRYTLETYIFQFHIWMRSTGINGSPKRLLVWVPGYYWVNFVVVTGVYIFVSIRFFKVTVTLSNCCIPTTLPEQGRALCVMFGACAAFWVLAFLLI